MSDPELTTDELLDLVAKGEITLQFTSQAVGVVTYPDGTVPFDPDYQPPAA